MLKIRLQRTGRKNDPSFRIVVVEGTEGPRTGNHIDLVGFYNAATKEKHLDGEKAKVWIGKGAQPSDTVYNILISEGVLEGKKRNVLPRKTPIVKEVPATEAAPAPATPAAETPEAETPAASSAPAEEAPKEEPVPLPDAPAEAPEEKANEAVPAA